MPSKLTVLRSWLTVCLLLFATIAFAQQRTVTGKVTNSSDQQPVFGATVTVKGTTVATTTDASGNFSINVPQGRNVLVISFVGFDSKEVNITGDVVNVVLEQQNSALNEVVVTGYTAQKKKDITGSVAVVDVKQMKSVAVSSPEQMLQGQAAGVNVITSGMPGGGSNIFIRGITAFGDVTPLVLIDGVPGSLHDINATDIESVQVLKDAGAASIYGVRGSNGVIVVTTKRGRGRATVTYDGYYGTQKPLSGNVFNLANTKEMADLTIKVLGSASQLYVNGQIPDYFYGVGTNYPSSGQFVAMAGDPAIDPSKYNFDANDPKNDYLIAKANQVGTDWYHECFKPANTQSHTITASGGSDKSSYLFSLGYFNQQGTLINTYLKRYSARINTVFNVKDNIRIGENAYVFFKQNPTFDLQSENIVNYIYRQQPIIPVYDIMGHYAGTFNGPELGNDNNPVAVQQRTSDDRYNIWDVIGNVYAEVDFLRHFTARTSFGGTIDNQYGYNYGWNTYENKESHEQNRSFSEYSQFNSSWTWTNTVTYNNVFAQKHSVKALAGSEAIQYKGRGLSAGRVGYFTDDPNYRVLSNGTSQQTNSSYGYINTLYSIFGRVDYGYNDKYLLSVTVRRDGSSRFGPNSRYGTFPSFSGAWRLSNEDFMKSVSWINDLKIRGGWGKLGSQTNVDPANQYSLYGGSNQDAYYDIGGTSTSTVQGFRQTRIGNLSTSWEEDVVSNIGLDATLFNSKVDFSFEYYKKSVNGLLFTDQAGVMGVGGASLPSINIGDVQNKGIDAAVTYHGAIGPDFRFNAGLNVTAYKSEIINIPGTGYFDAGGVRQGNFVRNQAGHPISAFFGYEVIGLFQSDDDVNKSPTQDAAAPGRFKYRDVDGDNKITDADRVFFGNPNPDFTYGINLSGSYKNFDFSMVFYGSQGNDVINYVRYWTDFFQSFQGAKSKDLANNSWTPSNTNAKVPIAENNGNFSTNGVINSYYLEDGSFFKCRSVQIGYAIPGSLTKRFGIDKFRVYGQILNLFTITKYTGQDPELAGNNANAFGLDYGNYPNNQKNFIVGVSLSF